MNFSSRHLLSRLLNGAEHSRVRKAPAEDPRHAFLNLLFASLGILVEERLGGQNYCVKAKTALRRLLVNECLLKRVRLLDRSDSLERGDLQPLHGFNRSDAGADRLPLHE